ncbi:MAG: hypothetical protein EBS89_11670 [Proteobacteria bacterium]|nr:hypothetical protein [Pseudomonadota bacterium]
MSRRPHRLATALPRISPILYLLLALASVAGLRSAERPAPPAGTSIGLVWLETEFFEDLGGWTRDWQFVDQMGSPYLMAIGYGTPVADARRADLSTASKPVADEAPAPPPVVAQRAEPVVDAPVPAAQPAPAKAVRLGVGGLTQPSYASSPTRIIYYDQPSPGEGGTFAIEASGAEPRRERPEWGHVDGDAALMTIPRPAQRDSIVMHLATGRQWSLPTTSSPVFSGDGTVVAFTASAAGAPGGPSTGAGLAGWTTARWGMTTLAVGAAESRRRAERSLAAGRPTQRER